MTKWEMSFEKNDI